MRTPSTLATAYAALAIGLGALCLGTPGVALAQKNFDTPPQMNGQGSQGGQAGQGGQNGQSGQNSQGQGGQTRRNGDSAQDGGSSRSDRNTRFTLINNSDMVIDNLNISPVSDSEWGDDLLGTLSLPAHSRLIAGPADDHGCVFDVRVVYHDRREEVRRRQNLCDAEEITFDGRSARRPQRRAQSDD